MRHFMSLIREAVGNVSKLDRSAFVYMQPQDPADQFAQCATCQHFKPAAQGCALFATDDRVQPEDSCGLYIHGQPDDEQPVTQASTPHEAGFVHGPVRCVHCAWGDDGSCGLYTMLNQKPRGVRPRHDH